MIIKLTRVGSNLPTLVNMSHVTRVQPICADDYVGKSRLHTTDKTTIDVTETPDEIYAMIQPPIKPAAHFQYEIELTDKKTNLPIFLDASSIKCIEPGVGLDGKISTYVRTNGGEVYGVVESSSEVKRIRDEALDKLKNRLVPPIKSNNRTTFIHP